MSTARTFLKIIPPVLLSLTACQAVQNHESAKPIVVTENTIEPLHLIYKKGQVLTFVFIDDKEGAAAAASRQKYYQSALSMAEGFGLKRDVTFGVTVAAVGSFKPAAVTLYSWPDKQAEDQLLAHLDWPAAKALRPQGWDGLRTVTAELDADMNLTIDPNKTYTIATAWLNPEHPENYERYMAGIKDGVAESGGKFMYKMYNPSFETHTEPFAAPDQITLVEWESPASLAAFRKTRGFKQNAKYLTSGTKRFELLLLSAKP